VLGQNWGAPGIISDTAPFVLLYNYFPLFTSFLRDFLPVGPRLSPYAKTADAAAAGVRRFSVSRSSTRCKGGNSRARQLPNAAISPGCGARIARRAINGACALRPLPLLHLAVSATGGARLRSPLESPSTKFYGKSRTRR